MNRDSSRAELALVLADQQLERLLVAALRSFDQLLVDLAVRHRRLPVSRLLIFQTLNGWLRAVYRRPARAFATTLLLQTWASPIGSALRRVIRATLRRHWRQGAPLEPHPQAPERVGRQGVRQYHCRPVPSERIAQADHGQPGYRDRRVQQPGGRPVARRTGNRSPAFGVELQSGDRKGRALQRPPQVLDRRRREAGGNDPRRRRR